MKGWRIYTIDTRTALEQLPVERFVSISPVGAVPKAPRSLASWPHVGSTRLTHHRTMGAAGSWNNGGGNSRDWGRASCSSWGSRNDSHSLLPFAWTLTPCQDWDLHGKPPVQAHIWWPFRAWSATHLHWTDTKGRGASPSNSGDNQPVLSCCAFSQCHHIDLDKLKGQLKSPGQSYSLMLAEGPSGFCLNPAIGFAKDYLASP